MTPKSKPKNYSKILDMLNTEDMAKSLSPKTYVNLVGEYSRKAFDNGEISEKEYMRIVRPLFGDAGIMATKKIDAYEKELERYATGGRVNFLKGGDTSYNKMVTEMYIKAGGQEATGMDIDTFAEKYFKKFATGGRAQFGDGTGTLDTPELLASDSDSDLIKAGKFARIVRLLMDEEGFEFGEAVKEAMRQGYNKGGITSLNRENLNSGTMPKSERWMRDYFFSGKGGYDDRMSYQEFALGPGQELYKRFSND